jgi:hypothetical protein
MTAVLTCPQCNKKFKTREDAKGKRVKCPACAAVFVAEEVAIDVGGREPVAQAAPPMATAAPAPAAAVKPVDDDDEDGPPNPYTVGTLDIRARCPNCANLMESEDAVICLFCGYNTLTRVVGETKKVVAHTHIDRGAWLMPGIGCAAGIFLLVMFDITYVFGLGSWTRGIDKWYWNLLNSESLRLWMTIISLGVMWALGQFAFKRLLLEPTPPEIEID